jgi:hypothetical protein
MGEGNYLTNTTSIALKGAKKIFNQLGGGIFLSIENNIFISLEEDESSDYYLLSTTNKSLMDIDDLFNFARKLFHENKERILC